MHVVVRTLTTFISTADPALPLDAGNTHVAGQFRCRVLLEAMSAGEWSGLLMDPNMTPPRIVRQFFGIPACTAADWPELALRTDARGSFPGFTNLDPVRRNTASGGS